MSSDTLVEEEAFSSGSALVFAIISFVLYWWFLRPTPNAAGARGRPAAATSGAVRGRIRPAAVQRQQQRAAQQNMWNPPRTAAASRNLTKQLSEAAAEMLGECQSKPNHVASPLGITGLGGCNLLNESGLVSFLHTQAATAVSSETATLVRQDRAKILSRLCQGGGAEGSGSAAAAANKSSASSSPASASTASSATTGTITPPPSRGSTVVLSLSQADLSGGSSSLSRILYALGTFYNIVVIVMVDAKNGSASFDRDSLVGQLRRSQDDQIGELTESILPSHRILLAATTVGRVALVRQLSKVAMVVDWDTEVESQLTRFGYKVTLVPNWSKLLD